jgi:hypothetical protein
VPEAGQSPGLALLVRASPERPAWYGIDFRAARAARKLLWGSVMRTIIEQLFEAVEASAGRAVFSITASLALTGCLRFFWE